MDLAALKVLAAEIKNETGPLLNTATRLGTMLDNIINSFEKTIVSSLTVVSATGSTAETILYSILIPANTIKVGDTFVLDALFYRTLGNTGTLTARWYFNTNNSLSGATSFGYTNYGTSYYGRIQRSYAYPSDSSLLGYYPMGSPGFSDIGVFGGVPSAVTVNFAVDQYLIFTSTNSNIAEIKWLKSIQLTLSRL